MGVQGLTPFLQKTCPGVIKQFPERLHAFAGKRIVIDGTLITQRYHFAPMPQPYRHVLAWYRLATHLKNNNVEAICVFDGKKRSIAKEREIERRRRDRMITAARGEFEYDRLDRLRRLTGSLRSWRSVGADNPEELASLKRHTEKWIIPADPAAGATARVAGAASELAGVAAVGLPAGLAGGLAYLAWRSTGKAFGRSSINPPKTPTISYDSSGELEILIPSEEREGLVATVSHLYSEYCRSIPQLASLSRAPSGEDNLPDFPANSAPEDEVDAAKLEYAMSKNQQGLALEEAQFWTQFAQSVQTGSMEESITCLAESLEAKSSVLSESYMRRTHPPTLETYNESKEILRAMGIPCIEPSGPYEAEALAASVVLHGYADFVASEDTDVLIYDAPLIRNIAGSLGPIVVISGAEVRTVLQLDRAQFIDFALLLGTDFSQRIKNVGPTRALKFIRKHGSIEQVLEHETQYTPRVPQDLYLEQVQLARDVFHTLPPLPDKAFFEQREEDEKAVSEILDRYGLRQYSLDEVDYSQALSGNYFGDNPAAA